MNRLIGYPIKIRKNFYLLMIMMLSSMFVIGYITPKLNKVYLFQMILLLAFTLIGVLLSYFRSRMLLVYILSLWALMPGIRRISDWMVGEFQSVSLLSVGPLLVTSTILFSLMHKKMVFNKEHKRILYCFLCSFIYALILGVLFNKAAAIYEMANYVVPALVMIYSLTLTKTELQKRDFWVSSLSNIAVIISVYGWIQYFYLPPWDKLWMENVQMNSIGLAEPMSFRIFSTLNSPGPFALFLSIAVIPMILERRWRGAFGWFGVFIVLSALAISLVRSSWIFSIVGIIVYILFSTSTIKKIKYISLVTMVVIVLLNVITMIPGGNDISERFSTLGNLEEDNSFNARLQFTMEMAKNILKNPIGHGFGASGVSTKVGNNGSLGENGTFDNGILNIFFTFGWVGGILFFYGLFLIFKILKQKLSNPKNHHKYYQLGTAIIVALLVSLLGFNSIPGVGGLLIWFMLSLSFVNEANEINSK
ncbi:O-antigen ligase family protein [Bacillus sp. B1-b2]|nr:O-antigen ligase family protein [Bacillus sp. B1-b2]